jgi:putative ABC transport system permease protein
VIPLSLWFAARELRGGVKGFRIFLACLALGVAAIAAAGSTAEAFRQGLAAHAAEILGGDLSVSVEQRQFTSRERAAIERLGRASWVVGSRAMAEAPSGERRLVQLRGVSASYPLAGTVELEGGMPLAEALKPVNGVAGAAVEAALLEKLHLRVGDRFLAGEVPLVARAVLLGEPDRLSRGFALGPRVLTTAAAVEQGGFLTPGLPFVETARIALPPGVAPKAAAQSLRKALPGRALHIRLRDDATPGIGRMIDQLEYFLGFIGLASLVAGGLGVFGAVAAYLEGRKPVIAVLKALGGDGALVRNLYLAQIGLLALLGVAIGLTAGAAAPFALGALIGDKLPVPALFAIYPEPLVRAGTFGLLAAAAFSLVPLGRARATPPASLFRRDLAAGLKPGLETLGAGLAAAALAGLALAVAPTPLAAAIMIAGVTAAFILLWALGLAAAAGAGRLRSGAHGIVRLGLANLAGPRSAARTAAPAIGLGVALLAAVVLIQSSLLREVSVVAPRTAPALVFTDIPGDRAYAFDVAVAEAFGRRITPQDYLRMPFVTGRIVAVKGRPVDRSRIDESQRWAYDRDIQLSALSAEPRDARIVAGRWWPLDYRGPPLVAMEAEVARAADLRVGDTVSLAILGRQIDARVAALRDIDIGAFGANFSVVINASALAGANLQQVAIAKASKAEEAAAARALGRDFPDVGVISVREQLEAATDLFSRLVLAIRGAAAVAALAGLLVLAGAIAARAQARTREAAVLKVLGASRGQILGAYVLEYGAVGVIAGLAGVALGYAAAWPVVVKVFHAEWSVDWGGVAALVGGASVLAAVGGALASLQALSRRPAPALRAE